MVEICVRRSFIPQNQRLPGVPSYEFRKRLGLQISETRGQRSNSSQKYYWGGQPDHVGEAGDSCAAILRTLLVCK
jgi:hypothetical protein